MAHQRPLLRPINEATLASWVRFAATGSLRQCGYL